MVDYGLPIFVSSSDLLLFLSLSLLNPRWASRDSQNRLRFRVYSPFFLGVAGFDHLAGKTNYLFRGISFVVRNLKRLFSPASSKLLTWLRPETGIRGSINNIKIECCVNFILRFASRHVRKSPLRIQGVLSEVTPALHVLWVVQVGKNVLIASKRFLLHLLIRQGMESSIKLVALWPSWKEPNESYLCHSLLMMQTT
jgi:hypothetical protein